MIDTLHGVIKNIEEQKITIDVHGIGFAVSVVNSVPRVIGEEVFLYIQCLWSQEHGPALYGFMKLLDKTVFGMIIQCVGIGPKIGLAVLNKLGAVKCVEAIQAGNIDALSEVSGVGPKKAEQIIVQLRNKIHKLLQNGDLVCEDSVATVWYELDQALSALHYSRTEIGNAIEYVRSQVKADAPYTFDSMLRKALLYLSSS